MTNPEFGRRAMLAMSTTAATVAIAGCMERYRELTFNSITLANVNSDEYTLEIRVVSEAGGNASKQWSTFHDVAVMCYDINSDLVGEYGLGDIGGGGYSESTISVVCTGFPYIVTFAVAESPCDGPTGIAVAYYQGVREGEHYWLAERSRECGEGLPPELPETTVTPPS